jgi:hypothetical protein
MGTAAAARRLVGVAVWPFMQPLHERLTTFARMALGEDLDAAVAEGLDREPLAVLDEAAAWAGPPPAAGRA